MKKLSLAACAAFALTATSASAGGYWQNGSYYTYATTAQSQTYAAPSYATSSGTAVVGTVGPIQSAGTVTYAQPTYTQPAYTQPIYVAPASTTTYTTPTYTAPVQTYTTPRYTAPTTRYVRPATTVYAPAPTYARPAYAPVQPQYDARDRVRDRIRNQRNRIERALERGELRRGEERRLRQGLREIRQTFRAYRDNDGYVGRHEEAQLMAMLNRNSKRIRRLANNDRVAGYQGPYAY